MYGRNKTIKNTFLVKRYFATCVSFSSSVSSNITEVIRAVLNYWLFFYEKISHAPKSTKKHKKATKQKHKTQISV